jgi:hypothetical protein
VMQKVSLTNLTKVELVSFRGIVANLVGNPLILGRPSE